ncbi:MAG: TIGR04348 family glycosyltransferase [Betaproteobacteria bacterium]|nr:TIGR04348 family glycosyltransferase [Betaproteobacteria bacterium]
MALKSKSLVIVSPALAAANNGNWQTAWRWARMLSAHYRTDIVPSWPGPHARADYDAMIALHARRSAPSIAAWAARAAHRPLAVVLTGTDLYRDILGDAHAQRSLQLADRLVVLQDLGVHALPQPLRSKACVIYQSCSARQPLPKTTRHLRAVMVGHLRDEKQPQLLYAAARQLRARRDIFIDHIGAPLDAALAGDAERTARDCPNYRWLGALPHEATRRHIQRAHLLVHVSAMEGGAHVVMEAVRSGTPVIATRIDGNVGMLGQSYAGYMPTAQGEMLAEMLIEARVTQTDTRAGLLARLRAQCDARAALFEPAAEKAALHALVDALMETPR